MRKALADGPLTRAELVERLGPLGMEITPERRMHFIGLAVASGLACLGPDGGRTPKLATARSGWVHASSATATPRCASSRGATSRPSVPPPTRTSPDGPACRLATSGRDARDRVRAARDADRRHHRMGAAGSRRRAPEGTVRLLPAWDTYLLGYRDREFIAGARWNRIAAGGGIYVPAIVRDGTAIGTWAIRGPRETPEITTEPFARPDAATDAEIEAERADIRRFEGVKIRPTAEEGNGGAGPWEAGGPHGPRHACASVARGGMPTRSSPEAGLAGDEPFTKGSPCLSLPCAGCLHSYLPPPMMSNRESQAFTGRSVSSPLGVIPGARAGRGEGCRRACSTGPRSGCRGARGRRTRPRRRPRASR